MILFREQLNSMCFSGLPSYQWGRKAALTLKRNAIMSELD